MPVTAIGDSVMLGAAGALQARLGSSGYIDAKKSRQWKEGVAVAHQRRTEGALGRVVLVHLGNNGPVTDHDVDAMMAELDGVPYVLLVTVRVDKSWQGAVNHSFEAAATRYPKVRVVDWYAHSEGHREWFASDGTHLKPAGARAYADLLAGAVPPPDPSPTTTTVPPETTTTSTTTTTIVPPPPA